MTNHNPNDSVAGMRFKAPHQHGPHGHAKHAPSANIPLRDMFEMASLDAMGLLDDAERRAFDETFARLAPAVQAQLRDQQTRIADMSGTLPHVEAPETLRQRVLDAVAGEIDAVTRSAGRIAPEILPSRGVSPIWRAAAIGCAAAAIVFGFATLQMNASVKSIQQGLNSNAVADMFVKEFGPRFENALMDGQTQFIQFAVATQAAAGAPADPNGQPMAVILLDPKTRTAQLYCKDLPNRAGVYNLVIVDPSGRSSDVVLPFRASGARAVESIAKLDLNKGATLQITTADADARTLLKSNNL